MRWQQGRETIAGMISRGELERVSANREHADLLLAQAGRHLSSAQAIATGDPAGARGICRRYGRLWRPRRRCSIR
jgi:hypothetical protein